MSLSVALSLCRAQLEKEYWYILEQIAMLDVAATLKSDEDTTSLSTAAKGDLEEVLPADFSAVVERRKLLKVRKESLSLYPSLSLSISLSLLYSLSLLSGGHALNVYFAINHI